MPCNCGGQAARRRNPAAEPATTRTDNNSYRVYYPNGSTQVVPDEHTARAVVAVNGGRWEPVSPPTAA